MLYRILGLAAAATLGYLVKPMANRCKDASLNKSQIKYRTVLQCNAPLLRRT